MLRTLFLEDVNAQIESLETEKAALKPPKEVLDTFERHLYFPLNIYMKVTVLVPDFIDSKMLQASTRI